MIRMPKSEKRSRYFAMMAMLATQVGHAGGFSLYTEGSAAEIGNFAAGAAAEGADASIGWYNPAGLVLLKKEQALVSGVGVFPSTKISGVSSFNTIDYPSYTQSFSGLQGGRDAVVPAVHYARPLGERAAFGFSLVSPFGLSTKWGDTSPVRYAATLTKLTAITASPELSGLLTDHLSVGAGLDLQWAKVNFDGTAGSPAELQDLGSPFVPPTYLDSYSANQGTSTGVGFHAGVLGLFNDRHTRIGLNYQSAIAHQFYGHSTLTGRLADPDTSDSAVYSTPDLRSNNVSLPSIVTLSAYQDINAQWAVLGSVVYTGWDVFKTIALTNVAGFSQETFEQTPVNLVTPQDYKNAWRFAVGANYNVSDRWLLRAGAGYDETPTVDAQRDIRLPDSNRWALSLGTHYQVNPSLGFDVGYTYLFAAQDAMLDSTLVVSPASTVNINGRANNHAQLAGAQVVWTFDRV